MYRVCDLCGGVDEEPRHVFAGVTENMHPTNEALEDTVSANIEALHAKGEIDLSTAMSILSSFRDTTSSDRHLGCCADDGCPTGTCQKE